MERVAELPAWILTHLQEKLTVEELAARASSLSASFQSSVQAGL